ncbi:hypothetical protein S7711_00210 [Stachybotrys chartarum IBT 7711]|uniref:ER transporter 6TM N-terminal domain-containing protein n=1 Tax=Stachybotrys chartarum (strain CBS 109288 / IBT 7711) TaxID=1280523 RepID=A0A084B3T0_STACB|nr:hypothetical protein S7711_00210 [Stachybotrys chartarum IBT 7711]
MAWVNIRRPRTLPAWLNHFNARDLKILARCWVAVWVAFLCVFVHPVLLELGQAAFFAALLLMIVPPASILCVYLLAALTLLLGMCLAWCWGLLTMKAAMAARPAAETSALLQQLQTQAAEAAQRSGQSPQWEAQILVHDGFMLDARVTAVFFSMGLLFIYVLARLRCANPKFMLMQLFGSIATNLFLLFGPTLPSFTGDLAAVLVKPGAIGIGLGVVCCLFLFPQSTSYVALESMEKLIGMMDASFESTSRRLHGETMSIEDLKATKARILGKYKATQPALGFLPLDLSRGRWNADDVKSLVEPLRVAMMGSFSLLDVHASWVVARERQEKTRNRKESSTDASEKLAGSRERSEGAHVMDALRTPEEAAMHDEALASLGRTTKDTLSICSESVKLSARCIHAANSCRWKKPKPNQFEDLTLEAEKTLATLRSTRETCVKNTTEGVLEAYDGIFTESGDLKPQWELGPRNLRGIILTMVIEERILVASQGVEKLLKAILHLMKTRTRTRFWPPSRLKYAFSWFRNTGLTVPDANAFDDNDNDKDPDGDESMSVEEDSREAHRRLRISRGYPHKKPRNAASRAMVAAYRWLFNTSGVFAIRMVLVTFITAIPAVIPNSAGFFYREKGIWAVISAQTAMVVYMADFTFSLVTRVFGTLIGGVLGMLAWYVGSGDGIGNPYGMAASTGVFSIVVIWLRIFLPPAYTKGTILGGATFCLVIGFSYDQGHILQYGLPGQGYEAFWKRAVLVLVGFTVAIIVQIVPSPPSATRHVQKVLSCSVRTLSDHYALLLSHWGQKYSPLGAVAEELSISVAEKLQTLTPMIGVLQYEMSLSPFDQKTLRKTQDHVQAMNQSLRRLLDLSSSLPQEFQDRLANTFGLLDDRMIGDTMAVLGIVEQSLTTGSPLPERMPTPLIGRFYDYWRSQDERPILNTRLVRDDNYRRYCVAMSAYLKFLATIDDLVVLLKEGLGECHVLHPWESV